jgi:hypothetical protein
MLIVEGLALALAFVGFLVAVAVEYKCPSRRLVLPRISRKLKSGRTVTVD